MTLLLRRSDLERLLDIATCLDALRGGFVAQGAATATATVERVRPQRVRTDLPGRGTATALIPGLVEGVPAYTVKVNAKFPDARPALRGVVCLHDLATGELLAVLDSATVTAWRTGLAAALGTHQLARPDADRVGVIGAGAQASLVVRGLAALRPVRSLVVHDLEPDRAAAFAAAHAAEGSVEVAADPAEVARRSGIVVLATWSRSPLLSRADVPAGSHLTSVGADEPGKVELAADLLTSARVFVDDVDLASASGALGNVGLGPDQAAGTLGEVLSGVRSGRTGAPQITVYAPIGLPWQDLALSWVAYQAARAAGAGTTYDWLS